MNIQGNYYFGQESIITIVDDYIKKLKKGKGGLILIEGDTGSGKSNILNAIEEHCKNLNKDIRVAKSEAQVPVANFKVGSIQPFQPFINILEVLEKPDSNAKTKLAQNIGLTVLASLPLVDTFAYAYKEINRDIKQFHQDQKASQSLTSSSIYDFFVERANKVIKDNKVIILLDNMHWCDSQSIEFLNSFVLHDFKSPFLIICTYREFMLETQGLPLVTLTNNDTIREKIEILKLKPLDLKNIRELSKLYFRNYKPNNEFEEWIMEKSEGNPGMVSEYLRYFSKFPPFDDDGELVMNFKDNEYLPGTWSAVFSQQIEFLTEEEKHILTICAAEGIEFTANIIAKLLNIDVLETIQKLRAIQNKTGFIKSIGPQLRYGLKTTTYKFSQVFYQSFFDNLLEYEEKVELHSKISEMLKIQFVNTNDDDLKNQIAPFLAAHSIESGDTDTAGEMLYYTAQNNKEIGGDELLDNIKTTIKMIDPTALELCSSLDNLKELNKFVNNEGINIINGGIGSSGLGDSYIDFRNIKKSIVNDLINDNHQVAINKLNMYLDSYSEHFNEAERIQLLAILSKSLLDIRNYDEAKAALSKATALLNDNIDKNTIAYLNNAYAIYYIQRNDFDNALHYLEKNAEISPFISADTKIMTSALISQIYKNSSESKYRAYKEAALNLIDELNYDILKNELIKF